MFDSRPQLVETDTTSSDTAKAWEHLKTSMRHLKAGLKLLDPAALDGLGAMAMVEDSSEVENLAEAWTALVAARVQESGAWRNSGERTAAHWMANKTGTSVGSALGTLGAAAKLPELDATAAAIRDGKLSQEQTKEIVAAAAMNAAAEKQLLAIAVTEDLATLKDACARVKAAAVTDENERYVRIHQKRRIRHWSDSEGAFRLDALLTPDAGAKLLAALAPFRERIFKEAVKQKRKEPLEAYLADALIEMADQSRSGGEQLPKGPAAMVNVFIEYESLKRGHTEDGEFCEIAGVGPVAVATAKAFATDSFLKVLVTDGIDIKTVSHPGRTINARLRTALHARAKGKCEVQGCAVRHHLQIDHIVGNPNIVTELDNLQLLCPHHHFLKTYRSYRIEGEPGARVLYPRGELVDVAPARGP